MNKNCAKISKCSRGVKGCMDSGDIGCDLCNSGKCANKDMDFEKIVDNAFYPEVGGKKDSHQYHIKKEPYEIYRERVKALKNEILNAKNFDEILELITFDNKFYEHIKGIDGLTEYDIAFRIGRCLGKCPDKIYMHTGTKVGAEKLKSQKISAKYLSREDLAEYDYFADTPICQIENFLCVCKEHPDEESFKCYKELHAKGEIK